MPQERNRCDAARLDVPDETLGLPVMVLPEDRTKTGTELRIPIPSLLGRFWPVSRAFTASNLHFPAHAGAADPRLGITLGAHARGRSTYGVNGKITPHTLRRSARTGWAELNVPREICEAMLNHAPPRLVATYDKAERMGERAAAMTLWCDTVAAAVERARAARQWEAAIA